MPEVKEGDDLADLILKASEIQGTPLEDRDIIVVTQKIVSKTEGALVDLKTVVPSELAKTMAADWGKDARHVEVVLQESRRIVRMDHGVLITETKHGFICANSGVDASNVPGEDMLCLLPKDPDSSAEGIREAIRQRTGHTVAVIISDTFGRPWRDGTTDIAIGTAGMNPLKDYRGDADQFGRTLRVSVAAVADEVTGAAELVTRKNQAIPVTLVRGFQYEESGRGSETLIRDASLDMFR
jgi:coenzyme F420-0:L-glutamate ligase/coenzyme F420-1:gamma-L-glutamate ligase